MYMYTMDIESSSSRGRARGHQSDVFSRPRGTSPPAAAAAGGGFLCCANQSVFALASALCGAAPTGWRAARLPPNVESHGQVEPSTWVWRSVCEKWTFSRSALYTAEV